MFVSFFRMVIGALLVFSSFHLTFVSLRHLLEMIFPNWRFLHAIFSVIVFAVSEIIGINLLIDPVVPGQAVIYVHAEELVKRNQTPFDLRVEIAVANFGGNLNSNKIYRGRFDERGIYTVLIEFGWLQSYIRTKVFKQNKSDSIEVRWDHISTWARLGLTEKHIYISE